MQLEKLLKNFYLDDNERELIKKGDIVKDWTNASIESKKQYVPKSFKDVATTILNGHFSVEVDGNIVRKIYPVCVELYYHEESGSDAIKDYIVYHRNKPKRFNTKPSLFKNIVLNAHQSGIDIAFEHESMIDGQFVQVRASALIRGFKVEVINSEYDVETVDIDATRIDKRSTYLYNALLSNLPILEGFSIKWVDGELHTGELDMKYRQNVFPYEVNSNGVPERIKKEISNDGRCWQFFYK